MIAASAAANAAPAFGQTEEIAKSAVPTGFNRMTHNYADFCALPPDKRVFYTAKDGSMPSRYSWQLIASAL